MEVQIPVNMNARVHNAAQVVDLFAVASRQQQGQCGWHRCLDGANKAITHQC
jgi:hypothetical protein